MYFPVLTRKLLLRVNLNTAIYDYVFTLTFISWNDTLFAHSSSVPRQVHTQKRLVGDLTHCMQQVRTNVKHKKIEIENKCMKMENCQKQIDDLTSTLGEIESRKLNVEEKTKRLEKMIEVCYNSKKKLFGKIIFENKL